MRAQIRHIFYSLAPAWLLRRYVDRRLQWRAGRLAAAAGSTDEPSKLVEILWPYFEFRPIQIESEIVSLLERVKALEPRRILEIGAASGGTTFLFSAIAREGTTMVSIDLGFDRSRSQAVKTIAHPGVELHTLCRDSHQRTTVQEVSAIFREAIDFLFIDGDHSYEGVKSDYEMYAGLVRPGGLIAFHDIVPDMRMRTGELTHVDVGGVPIFWNELKARLPERVEEIVENPSQDGYGIGLLHR